MRRGWLVLGLMAAVVTSPALAQNIATRVRDNEDSIRDLQRQIDLLRRTNKELEARADELSKPAHDIIDAYLRDKGIAAVAWVDADGNPLEETVQQISVSGGFRMRYDLLDNFTDFDDDASDSMSFINNRLRLGVGFIFSEKVEANIELMANYLSGGGSGLNNFGQMASAIDLGDADMLRVYQANVTFKDVNPFGRLAYLPVDIVLGRQELAYGTRFLLGDQGFDAGLSWDAVRVVGKVTGLQIDVFAAKLVENDAIMDLGGEVTSTGYNMEADAELYGLYGSYTGIPDTVLDAYVLFLRSGLNASGYDGWVAGEPVFNLGMLDGMHMWTLGMRAAGKFSKIIPGSFSYNAEIAVQLGDRTPVAGGPSQDVSALGAQVELKYTMSDVPWQPAIGLLFAYGSGDGDGDNDYERFDPLFQYNHAFYGLSDMFRVQNARIFGVTASASPTRSVQIGAAWYMSIADDQNDPMGGGVAWGGVATGDNMANEIDLWFDMDINRNCHLQLGWAMVLPDEYIEDMTGGNDTASRFYANLNLSF